MPTLDKIDPERALELMERALGLRGQVTVIHAFCLGAPDRDLVDPLIAQLAELDVAIMTTTPATRPAAPT